MTEQVEGNVSLKEFLLLKICSLEKVVNEKFVAIDETFEHSKEALKLQAAEYERRLEALNHENARILTAQNKSVSRELYDSDIKGLNDKIVLILKANSQNEGKSQGTSSTWAYVFSVIATVVSLAVLCTMLVR